MEEKGKVTEEVIKKVAQQFLKSYYKFRPRGEGDTRVALDMRAEGGVIADGYITFKKEDGSPFVGSFEATAYDSRFEVTYQQQPVLFNMDALAVASISTALFYLYASFQQVLTVQIYGTIATLALLLVVFAVFYFLYKLLFSALPRYRYIYAIEQFKQYYADEQWIAIAEDVFPHSDHPHFAELKRQCVREGIGLILVAEDWNPVLVVTPSRPQTVEKKKKSRPYLMFMDVQTWSLSKASQLASKARERIPLWDRIKAYFELPMHSIMRYKRSYWWQSIFMGISLIVLVTVFARQRTLAIREAGEDIVYLEDLPPQERETWPETSDFYVDSPFIRQYHKTPWLEDLERQVRDIEARGDTKKAKETQIDYFETGYDCSWREQIAATPWVVVYGASPTEARAAGMYGLLDDAGLEGGLIWLGCLGGQERDFVVYIGFYYATQEEAESQLQKFVLLLQENKTPFGALKVKRLGN